MTLVVWVVVAAACFVLGSLLTVAYRGGAAKAVDKRARDELRKREAKTVPLRGFAMNEITCVCDHGFNEHHSHVEAAPCSVSWCSCKTFMLRREAAKDDAKQLTYGSRAGGRS